MAAESAIVKSLELKEWRHRRAVKLMAWSIVAASILLSGYVATYWSLHWAMYRQWTSANGFDRQMSRVIRMPGDLYATSNLPGSWWWDQRKRDWQRRGRRAYEEERNAESLEEQSRQLQSFFAERERRESERRRQSDENETCTASAIDP